MKKLPFATVLIRGYIYDIIVLTGNILCIKYFKGFLEHQLSKDKVTPLFVIKMWNYYTILMQQPVIFFTQSLFSAQYLFTTNLTTNH